LRELDISWNVGIRPRFYLPLIDALGENRSLMSVNLSYNSLIDAPEEVVPPQKPTKTSLRKTGKIGPTEEIELEFYETEVKYSPLTEKILFNLF